MIFVETLNREKPRGDGASLWFSIYKDYRNLEDGCKFLSELGSYCTRDWISFFVGGRGLIILDRAVLILDRAVGMVTDGAGKIFVTAW